MSMPPVLTESARTSTRSPSAPSKPFTKNKNHSAADALKRLEEHILMDGFRIVLQGLLERLAPAEESGHEEVEQRP